MGKRDIGGGFPHFFNGLRDFRQPRFCRPALVIKSNQIEILARSFFNVLTISNTINAKSSVKAKLPGLQGLVCPPTMTSADFLQFSPHITVRVQPISIALQDLPG